MNTQHDECPHCGWTPAEQDKLSNDRAELLAALRACEQAFTHMAVCDCDWHMGKQHKADCPRGAMLAARAAIAKAEGV